MVTAGELLAVILAPSPALRYVRVSGQKNEVGMEGTLKVKPMRGCLGQVLYKGPAVGISKVS